MNWDRTFFKKKYHLVLVFALIFLIFGAGILSITLNYVKLNRDSALRELEGQVNAGSEQLQFYFQSLRSDLLRIERHLANTNMKVDKELYRYLNFVKGLRPDAIPAILILDANGNAVANTNPVLIRVNFSKSECLKNIQHTPNRVFLSNAIVLSDLSGRSEAPSKIFEDPLDIGFVLCAGVYSKGLFKGVVLFVLKGEPFFDQYSMAITEPASEYGFILQENGRILLHREVELRGTFLSDLTGSPDLTRANNLLKNTESTATAHSTIGKHMTVTSIIHLENQRWAVGIATTASKLAQETMRLIYTLGGLALLLGTIIFGLVFALIRLGRAEENLREYSLALEEARTNLEQKIQERTKELKEAHEALIRKERLAVLGQLSSGVAHEVRNPLGVIKNACYFLNMKMETIQDEAVKDNITIMNREIDTANRIIADLLDFARIKKPLLQGTDLNELVTEAVSKSSMPANITVITNLDESIPPIAIDPIQIGQVFLNLIENAVHAMDKGGTLTIFTRTTEGKIEVVFSDDGCGIPKENLKKIFEPLFTTKARGIGLGLAVSKGLAKVNGADIVVKSEEGKGSRFVVRFDTSSSANHSANTQLIEQ